MSKSMQSNPRASNRFSTLSSNLRSSCRIAQGDSRPEQLPFELLALEAALSVCCRALDQETNDVEMRVLPALERLSVKVDKRDLEEVRNLKSTLNRILVRVGKVKQACGLSAPDCIESQLSS